MPTDTTWVRQVRDPSDANVARTTGALIGRTDYLKRRLDAAELGEGVFRHDVTLDPDLLEGQAVYWNADTQRFEAALAGVETDPVSGALVPTAASDCLGVLWLKAAASIGSVLLFGSATLDITNAAGPDAPAGRYYLSADSAGGLTVQRPPVGVPVLYYDGRGTVYVQPNLKNPIEEHVHFRFDLYCRPAGHADQPELAQKHTIKSPDVTAKGWLPASLFGAKAPRRAAFGYNLAAHPELQRVWPPVPISAVELTWDRGNGLVGGTVVPLGADGLVVVDANGIWWMSDNYGDVPWPTATNTSLSSYPAESYPSSDTIPENPRFEKMRLGLAFARMTFATDKSVVTSLAPAVGSPIRFVDCDGNAADTGELFAKLDSQFQILDSNPDGSLVVKELNDEGKLVRGRVIEGVRSSNGNLIVTGSHTKVIGTGDDAEEYAQGLLVLDLPSDPAARDLNIQLVRLDNTKDRFYSGVPYLGMPADQASEIRGKLKVPNAGLPAVPTVKLRVQILPRANGTLPTLTVTYRVLPRPATGPEALPVLDTGLTFTTGQAVTANEYIEVESSGIAVEAGDVVLFTIARADDGYSGEVGLLDVAGVLYQGS